MRVAIFGASGMVGQGALRECLLDSETSQVISILRAASGAPQVKLREVVHKDFLDYSSIEKELSGVDACLFCLGVSSTGMSEEAYSRVTYDYTVATANALLRLNSGMSFIYVSGACTDSTERGCDVGACKRQTENALLAMPFRAAYMFRPGFIQPLEGIESKTASYRALYKIAAPLISLARQFAPRYITTTQELGRAMLSAAKRGTEKRVVEATQIREILRQFHDSPQRLPD
jgi:uncharacterized protein YbjT (DUF2867 family)